MWSDLTVDQCFTTSASDICSDVATTDTLYTIPWQSGEEPPTSGVREPRNPILPLLSPGVALEEPTL